MSQRMYPARTGSSHCERFLPYIYVRDTAPPPRVAPAIKERKGGHVLLSDDEVLTVRWLYQYGRRGLTYRKLAELYSTPERPVSTEYMEKLISGVTRTHTRLFPTPQYQPPQLPPGLTEK